MNSTRIYELMTTRPTVINTTTSVRDAAKIMRDVLAHLSASKDKHDRLEHAAELGTIAAVDLLQERDEV